MLRFDAAVARHWAATHSKDGSPKPLMPWPRQDVVEEIATPQAALAILMQSKQVKKKDGK